MRGRAPDLRDPVLRVVAAVHDGAFAGWAAARQTLRGFTTETGIGVGSTRARLPVAHPCVEMATNSLGTWIGAGDVYGVASGVVYIDNADDWKRAGLPYQAFKQ